MAQAYTSQDQLEEQFLEFRGRIIQESEERLHGDSEAYDDPEGWSKCDGDKKILEKMKLTHEDLDVIYNDDKSIGHYRDKVRPGLIQGPSTANEGLRKHLMMPNNHQNAQICSPYNTFVVSNNPNRLKELDGKAHNPWLDPFTSSEHHIYAYSEGSGSGLFRSHRESESHEVSCVYVFTTEPAHRYPLWYRFWAFVNFGGFYALRSSDGFWTRKYASVRFYLRLRIYVGWTDLVYDNEETVLGDGGATINRSGRIYYTRHIYEPAGIYLPPSTSIGVLLTARLRTYARGSGSYAELNFAEPPTNWIRFQDLMYQGANI